MKKPFKVAYVVKTKHGDLWRAIRQRGWNQRQTAEFLGIAENCIGRILNLNGRPPLFTKIKGGKAKLKRFKEKLMELTGKTFDDLFPNEVFNDEVMARAKSIDFYVTKDLATLKLGAGAGTLLALPEIPSESMEKREMLEIIEQDLSPKEKEIFDMVLDGKTNREIGKYLGVTESWVSAIRGETRRRLNRHRHFFEIGIHPLSKKIPLTMAGFINSDEVRRLIDRQSQADLIKSQADLIKRIFIR